MAVHCQPLVNSNAFIHEAECIADVQNAVKENYSFIAFGTDFNFMKAGLKSIHKLNSIS